MQAISDTLTSWVQSSAWVDEVRSVVEPGRNALSRLEVRLNPVGHDHLRDCGWAGFEHDLLDGAPSMPEPRPVIQVIAPPFDQRIEYLLSKVVGFPRPMSCLTESNGYRLLLEVEEGLPWFKGHFPGTPVLPGVVQLHWAVQVSAALFGTGLSPMQLSRLKFQRVVVPPAVLELKLERRGVEEVRFLFQSRGFVHSRGCLKYGESREC